MTSLSDRLRTQTVSDDETHEVFTLFHEAADKIDQLVEGLREAVDLLEMSGYSTAEMRAVLSLATTSTDAPKENFDG